jgi:hypothetical protein
MFMDVVVFDFVINVLIAIYVSCICVHYNASLKTKIMFDLENQ